MQIEIKEDKREEKGDGEERGPPTGWVGDASSPAFRPGSPAPGRTYPTSPPVWFSSSACSPPFPPHPRPVYYPAWYSPPPNLSTIPQSPASTTSSPRTPPPFFNLPMAQQSRQDCQNGNQLLQRQPRSFEALHAERAYLISLLQTENTKHTDFLRQIPNLEAQLADPMITDRRKIKKQIGWFKHRLNETIRQERAILGSLGQLTYEIQCRERVCQLDNERRFYQQAVLQQTEILRQMGSASGTEQLSFNPVSPAFQPQNNGPQLWPAPATVPCYQSQEAPMQWPGWRQQSPHDYFGYNWASHPQGSRSPDQQPSFSPSGSPSEMPIPNSTSSSSDMSPIVISKKLAELGDHPSPGPSRGQRTVSLNSSEDKLNYTSTHSPYKLSPKQGAKRMSLPALPGCSKIWDLSAREGKERDRKGSWIDLAEVVEAMREKGKERAGNGEQKVEFKEDELEVSSVSEKKDENQESEGDSEITKMEEGHRERKKSIIKLIN